MSKIPFTVSARTARLIGRENIASSKGAIIELVKNCYDADSKICIVYFDNYFSILHENISLKEYEFLLQNSISQDLINRVYEKQNTGYILRTFIEDEDKLQIKNEFKKLTKLYIIDAGEGMTDEIIKKHWMTIGTDNKENNVFTKTERVRSGAKGIGRFALDKLGDKCTMITQINLSVHLPKNLSINGCVWKVDWRDFEGEFKTIDKVEAELDEFNNLDLNKEIINRIDNSEVLNLLKKQSLQHGTILEVSNLRENWEDFFVNQIFSDLEQSIPPEKEDFNIFLYSSLETKKYGEVLGSLCDDYDYKLVANADKNQKINITIYRNEYDKETIDPSFFKRNNLSNYPYREEEFECWELEKTFSQLLPGFKEVDEDKVFNDIGIFEFTLYFMKKTYTTKDAEKFFYRKFRANERKGWLDNFGGIKLFRDNFRVRPYGEAKSTSFDWLGLGARKSQSPAGIAKKEGGYRVPPVNVAGTIKISRLTNVNFEDKSSREGLQENKPFLIFKHILTEIISIFEKDRAYIAREMDTFYQEKNADKIDKEKAEKLAKSILANRNKEQDSDKAKKENNEATVLAKLNKEKDKAIEKLKEEQKTLKSSVATTSNEESILAKLNKEKSEAIENLEVEQKVLINLASASSGVVALAELNEGKNEAIEKLEDEQKMLRGLASSGIVIASFTHELSNLNDVLGSRIDELKEMLELKAPPQAFDDVPEYLNPYIMMEDMRRADLKMQNWLKFSIGAARKDKRRRKKIYLLNYFENLKNIWQVVLASRFIEFKLELNSLEHIEMRVFEIDLDSIFNNLIVNSIDAFINNKEKVKRTITINLLETVKTLIITYSDNGPGLSKDISDPQEIFTALFTTKRNKHTGEEDGTGIGMWLIKSIVEDNGGELKLLYPDKGFKIEFIFPKKYGQT